MWVVCLRPLIQYNDLRSEMDQFELRHLNEKQLKSRDKIRVQTNRRTNINVIKKTKQLRPADQATKHHPWG